MNTKIIAFLRTAFVICLGILIPLGFSVMFMKSVIRKDALRCVDTFIENENVDLAKYITLEFENTGHRIRVLNEQLNGLSSNKPKEISECLSSFLKKNPDFKYAHVYNEKGVLISSSDKQNAEEQLNEDVIARAKSVSYTIEENANKEIELKFLMPQKMGKQDGILFLSVDWKTFDKYMSQVTEGSFPRMFYIISPSCKRYISANSLPKGENSAKKIVALGIHLAGQIQSVLSGLSTVSVSSIGFRVVKNEVKIPEYMRGEKVFFVTATDDAAMDKMSAQLTENLPIVFYLLLIVIFALSVVISIRLNNILNDLQIANKISSSTPLAIVIFNAQTGRIRKINMTATTLLRIQVDNLDQIDMWKMFTSNEDLEYIRNAVDSGIAIFNYEVLVQSFEAGTFWAVCSASAVEIDESKYIVLGILDINHRKEIEKKLANNSEMLERQVAERTADLENKALELKTINAELENAKVIADTANKTKSVFLTSVSSELKTPLNAIIGYAEILKEEAEDRQDNVTADDLGKIIGAANHLLSLINEILDLSQIESGKVKLFFENFNLETTLREIESVIMPVVTQNNNSLFIELAKGIGDLYTDETKFRQCILNLLSNAAKFTEFGRITLKARSFVRDEEDFIEVAVTDTGSGIDAERLPTLFDGFQGGNADNSAGLGLKITKEYVEYLGGTIAVESEIGVGSKFILTVPRVCKTEASDNVMIENSQAEREMEEDLEEEESDNQGE